MLTEGTLLYRFADVNYLYFTIFLFIAVGRHHGHRQPADRARRRRPSSRD